MNSGSGFDLLMVGLVAYLIEVGIAKKKNTNVSFARCAVFSIPLFIIAGTVFRDMPLLASIMLGALFGVFVLIYGYVLDSYVNLIRKRKKEEDIEISKDDEEQN